MSVKTSLPDTTDESLLVIDAPEPETNVEEEPNAGCQVRRKIEEYLEKRRYKEELGE